MVDYVKKVWFRDIWNNPNWKVFSWSTWKLFSECSEAEKKKANLRTIEPNEIVLDVESIEESVRVVKEVVEDGFRVEVFDSGSRGQHLHLIFDELEKYPFDQRSEIRLRFIENYGSDVSKKSDKGVISIADRPHHKTGRDKTFINLYNPKAINELPIYALVDIDKVASSISDSRIELPSKQEFEQIFIKNPKVLSAVQKMRGNKLPVNHLGKSMNSEYDFLIAKCLVENGLSKLQIFNFLKTCQQSKTITHGWGYYHFTFTNVLRTLNK